MQTESRHAKERIPWLMAGSRAVLGPVMILGERARWNGVALAALIIMALLSDIFDGVLARRWKCDTAAVRTFDSMADIVFYVGCAIALWMRHPTVVRALAAPVAMVLGLELLCLAIPLIKFGKLPSYHSWLAKSWGLVLASALVAAFVTKHPTGWLVAALALGALSNLEGLTMSLILPEWRYDLKTIPRASALRKRILLDRRRDAQRVARLSRRACVTVSATLLLAFTCISARASSIPSVTFIGGSSPGVSTGAAGTLETGSDNITFQWSSGSLAIPYKQIQNFSYREQRSVSLGILPIIVVSLFRPQIYRHIVSIS
jgi:CDP-diacylglycerol--glycerol-3-phosphate 3-phosphatidyltransferase